MRLLLTITVFLASALQLFSQQALRIVDQKNDPLPYAIINFEGEKKVYANLHGQYFLNQEELNRNFTVSYPGYSPKSLDISSSNILVQVTLVPIRGMVKEEEHAANKLIERAINNKTKNDPELRLNTYQYKSYNKLFIDKDTSRPGIPQRLIEEEKERGRRFLSENVSLQSYRAPNREKQLVEGFTTAGFTSPAYEILGLDLELPSLYKGDYNVYNTRYAGPLGEKAFKNYSYRILDTLANRERPAYILYFKPKRPRVVPGVEGILFLDTVSLAIQQAQLGFSGPVEMEAHHNYRYYEEENLWFPVKQQLFLRPGTGEEEISIFGGSISVGTVQKRFSVLDILLAPGDVEEDLYLSSTTTNYGIELGGDIEIPRYSAMKKAINEAGDQDLEFWRINRQEPFTSRDEVTEADLGKQISGENIERKIQIKNAISNGYFPLGPWNFELANFAGYNNYEGLRLGVGGETNENFSQRFKLNGYWMYGFKDRRYKFGLGAGVLLNHRTGTWLNFNYRDDIREVASYEYIKGVKDFSLFEPRQVNISYYYAHIDLEASLEHRITPRLESELQVRRSDISQLRDYAFLRDGRLYRDYTVSEATLGFLWRPSSQFISTPSSFDVYSQEYPVITGQISRGFSNILGGDFSFTKLGLKAQYQTTRLDRSSTHVILEGNLGFGELPLTHAFHAFPNNANREEILDRFAVAGKLSFETMYFNEFFSDRQASIHIRHRLRPIYISYNFQPEVVLVSRHVIGDFRNLDAHRNIEFRTLEHGYSEAGLEINKILLGFGLSTAYRYGAYHLPTFKENFSLKFTFEFQI